MVQDNNTIMKTNIYVQQTWASLKFSSQAKNENVKEHSECLLEETTLLYTLLVGVAFHIKNTFWCYRSLHVTLCGGPWH